MKKVLILIICALSYAQENNVCKTIKDYNNKQNNPNCWYNYIVNSTVPEIITKSGRSFIEYKVVTSDGYILTVFRIPNTNSVNKKRYPVFLQHGLITTCANWVSLGEDSLAFQLSDAGYDVWLGNYRGTQYSEEHVTLTVNDDKYWDYSIDDVALKDIPAVLKTIADETKLGGNIVYVGHSLGCSFGLMYASELPAEAQRNLKLMVLTAPAYKLSGIRTPIGIAAGFAESIYRIITNLGLTKVVSHEKTTKGILGLVCKDSARTMEICFNAILLGYGPRTGVEPDKYPMYFDQHPSGSSIKLIRHVSDFINNHFSKFDYGLRNMEMYGQYKPPEYDISQITVPTVVVAANNDWLTSMSDSINLFHDLSKKYRYEFHEIKDPDFNHIDYMFGKTAKTMYVDYVLKLFERLPTL